MARNCHSTTSTVMNEFGVKLKENWLHKINRSDRIPRNEQMDISICEKRCDTRNRRQKNKKQQKINNTEATIVFPFWFIFCHKETLASCQFFILAARKSHQLEMQVQNLCIIYQQIWLRRKGSNHPLQRDTCGNIAHYVFQKESPSRLGRSSAAASDD